MIKRTILTICASAALLAGCTGNPSAPAVPFAPSAAVSHASSASHLYVAVATGVLEYDLGGARPIRKLSGMTPTAMIVDRLGNLYVANVPQGQPGKVLMFAPNALRPSLTISTGVHYPNSLAVSPTRELYVSNYYAKLSVYEPGKTTPAYNIKSLFSVATAVDSDGDFYDAQLQGPYGGRGGVVKVYKAGASTPLRVIKAGTDNPAAVGLDKLKNVYVVNAGNVTVYAAGRTALMRTVSAGLRAPSDLAVDDKGYLYVADKQANTVTVYAPNSTKLIRTIAKSVQQPTAIALDDTGKLYVANARSVTVYDTTTGALLQTLSKGIAKPIAVRIAP